MTERPNEWTCVRCGARVTGRTDADDEPRPPLGWAEAAGSDRRLATCPTCRAAHDPDPLDPADLTSWFD